MSARLAMKGIGAGRLAIGLALVAVPKQAARGWLGETADTDGGTIAVRALGIRDALLGFMAIHVASADDPMVAARWSAAIAVCDLVDGAATAAARPGGRLGPQADAVIALGVGSALAGWAVAAKLRADAA
jgi:hypothetical protein